MPDFSSSNYNRSVVEGFTLIELSIVLVMIGLVVGGVLVGQNLINAAAVRAQISQIESYNTAARTFQSKYGYLPGDIPNPDASNFGFAARVGSLGRGDGNGLVEGICEAFCVGNNYPFAQASGETPLFWNDLMTAKLIAGFFYGGDYGQNPQITLTAAPYVYNWIPEAKIGQGNYVYVWEINNMNYYGVSAVTAIAHQGPLASTSGLTVQQAYSMDAKIDDGFPQTGNVIAQSLASGSWAAAGTATGVAPGTNAPASSTTCYDNANSSSNPMTYSLSQNQGMGMNCALSFQFQ